MTGSVCVTSGASEAVGVSVLARWWTGTVLLCTVLSSDALMADELSRGDAELAIRRATAFFRQEVACHGGYLWRYAVDLTDREGEGRASDETIWVQPPGTPTVGQAFLDAYRRLSQSGDRELLIVREELLHGARDAADALIRGQLVSGGWDYRIEFDPAARRRYAYRVDGDHGSRNTTTLDDNTTQSALRFLMRLDHVLEFQDQRLNAAVRFGLDALLKAQYPNGAWPQRYAEFPDPAAHAVRPAAYPSEWSRTYPAADYRGFYTINDNSLADVISTMLDAAVIYEDDRYRAAALRGGEFILRAQMPDPQPAWAQQYDAEMHPAWARKFEPPAITGGESQRILNVLLELYERTGERRFLEPVPPAVKYLRSSLRSDGQLARFYELQTNRPLYFTKDYELTYDDTDMPTHYAFVIGSNLDAIERRYETLTAARLPPTVHPMALSRIRQTSSLTNRAAGAARSLDARGSWVEAGELRTHPGHSQCIETRTFCRNLTTLAEFLAATLTRERMRHVTR